MDIKKENFLQKKTKRPFAQKNKVELDQKNNEKVTQFENIYNMAKSIYELRVNILIII